MSNNYSLEYIDTQNKVQVSTIEKIYTYSFPENERRDFNFLLELLNSDPYFNIVAVKDEQTTIGFITYWEFMKYIYIEHFAIDESYRGKGAGKFALNKFHQIIPLPIILEVEPPTNELSKRRISFYERLNFYLWSDLHYIQPPYRIGGESLKLILMSLGKIDLNRMFQEVVDTLYDKVYKVKALN
ncbi:MAG: GNAT family N-acetyltransferase [Bacteroidales bacterium]|nr:GNAT family N-acetyltransferase [Bacteroidales bacterium]